MNSTIQYRLRQSPKIGANIFSKLSLSWLFKLYIEGRKKNLNVEDLYEISERNQSRTLGDSLEKQWNLELSKHEANKMYEPSLTRAIIKTFYPLIIGQFILSLILNTVLKILTPFLLQKLIQTYTEYQNGGLNSFSNLCTIAGLLFLNTFVTVFVYSNYTKSAMLLGMKVKVACCALIYRKLLRLKVSSLSQTSNGQLINLLSNDVSRFNGLFLFLNRVFTLPFQFIIVLWFIWDQGAFSALVGLLILVLLTVPPQGYIAKLISTFREKIAKLTDKRVTLMNEIISGIQVIKMYAWEQPFEKLIETAREKEIGKIKLSNYLNAISFSNKTFVQRITIFVTAITITILGDTLNAAKIYSMYECFRIIERTLSYYFPTALEITAHCLITIKRTQTFLQLDEVQPIFIKGTTNTMSNVKNGEIVFGNYTASWIENKSVLKKISSKIKNGEIYAIIGPVGSGKSSLLNAILNEINIGRDAKISVNGTISYSSQDPWLFNSSIRNNILFGLPFDCTKYEQVIKACSLTEDFKQFPYGDDTLVGDKGVSLSGGQRARINLARAIYRNADIYLMDDPLSAVDAIVGKQIFQECIEKYLSKKTRILVTHQIQFLQNVHHIILLKNGEIHAEGSYDELLAKNLDFMKHLNLNVEEKPSNKNGVLMTCDVQKFKINSTVLEKIKPKINTEEMETNKLKMNLFYKYSKAAGNFWRNLILLLLMIFSQFFNSFCDYWLAYWTNLEEGRSKYEIQQPEIVSLNNSVTTNITYEIDDTLLSTSSAIGIYSTVICCVLIFGISKNLYTMSLCIRASRNLHNIIFNTLCRAPMQFFNENPIGRILNRFTKDMGAMDEILPRSFLQSSDVPFNLIGMGVLLTTINLNLFIPTVILLFLLYKIQEVYLMTAQDIKRIKGITKSPIFSHISSTFDGLTTIRACEAQTILQDEYDEHLNVNTSASYLSLMCTISLGICIDTVCGFYLVIVTYILIFFNSSESTGSEVGLALTQVLHLLFVARYGIKQSSQLMNQMTAVERIIQYTNIKTEGPFDTPEDTKVPKIWPKNGSIELKKLSMRYEDTEPNILKELSLIIHAGEKIGVVGRTGAGKSSFISSLFRLAIIDGEIIIDDLNVKNIGLHDLRSKISIIPQQPMLFSATLRFNLDPYETYEDHVLWDVLEEVKLKSLVTTLDFKVQSGGTNFSIGQRQLICIARAILKQNKILVLDEATANVDPHTDALIQQTIRDKFKSCTVITIAHRLNTIMDSDKVLVMDAGQMIEFDHPQNLLANKNGIFYKLYQENSNI